MDDAALKAATDKWQRVKQDIDRLRNEISGHQAQLARLEKESADLHDWIAKWHELVGKPLPPAAAEQNAKPGPVVAPGRPKNPDREIVVDEALQIIHERGEPISRRDLFQALKERGILLRGKDPQMVLSTMLWRSQDRIVRLVPFGYWPAGLPYGPHEKLQEQIAESDI